MSASSRTSRPIVERKPDRPQRPGGTSWADGSGGVSDRPQLSTLRRVAVITGDGGGPSSSSSSIMYSSSSPGSHIRAPRLNAASVDRQELTAEAILSENKQALEKYSNSARRWDRHALSSSTPPLTSEVFQRSATASSHVSLSNSGEGDRRGNISPARCSLQHQNSDQSHSEAEGPELPRRQTPPPRSASSSPYRSVPVGPTPLRHTASSSISIRSFSLLPLEVSEVPLVTRPSRSNSPSVVSSSAPAPRGLVRMSGERPVDDASRRIPSLSPPRKLVRDMSPTNDANKLQTRRNLTVTGNSTKQTYRSGNSSVGVAARPAADSDAAELSPASSADTPPRARSLSPVALPNSDTTFSTARSSSKTMLTSNINTSSTTYNDVLCEGTQTGTPQSPQRHPQAPRARFCWQCGFEHPSGVAARFCCLCGAKVIA